MVKKKPKLGSLTGGVVIALNLVLAVFIGTVPALAYDSPPPGFVTLNDWYAYSQLGNTIPTDTRSDVINIALYGPDLSLTEIVSNLQNSWAFYNTSCFSDVLANPTNKTIDHPWDRVKEDAIINDNQDCNATRHHARIWKGINYNTSGAVHYLYIAVSQEKSGCGAHCLVDFNASRNYLASNIEQMIQRTGWTTSHYWSFNSQSGNYVDAGIRHYDLNNGTGGFSHDSATSDGITRVYCIDRYAEGTYCPNSQPPTGHLGAGYSAAAQGDNYQGSGLSDLYLKPNQVSDKITIWFKNSGSVNWDSNTFLAYYDPATADRGPANGSFMCNAPGQDWYSCNPGLPAWDGDGRASGPGVSVPFVFQIKAPSYTGDFYVRFKIAQRFGSQFVWLNLPNGADTFDYFWIHVH